MIFFGIFMVITMVTLAFFKPSWTHKNIKKSNACLSMLFFFMHIFVSGAILVYGIWNMVCGIWYENGIHSVFTYVSHSSYLGCLQCSVSIPCFKVLILVDRFLQRTFSIIEAQKNKLASIIINVVTKYL